MTKTRMRYYLIFKFGDFMEYHSAYFTFVPKTKITY